MDSLSSLEISSCLVCLQIISASSIASLNLCMCDWSLKIFLFSFCAGHPVLLVFSCGLPHGLLHTQCCAPVGRSCSPTLFILGSVLLRVLCPHLRSVPRRCLISLSEALGYLEMAVTTTVPAFAITASLSVICACFAVSFSWLRHSRQAVLSLPLKCGTLFSRCFLWSLILVSSLFSCRYVMNN